MTWWLWGLLVWFTLSVPAAVLIGRAIALRDRRAEEPGAEGRLRDDVDGPGSVPGPRDGRETA